MIRGTREQYKALKHTLQKNFLQWWKCSALTNMVLPSYMYLLGIWSTVAEELNFKFYLILINSNLNNHIWLPNWMPQL